jgi:hypothetical protein
MSLEALNTEKFILNLIFIYNILYITANITLFLVSGACCMECAQRKIINVICSDLCNRIDTGRKIAVL